MAFEVPQQAGPLELALFFQLEVLHLAVDLVGRFPPRLELLLVAGEGVLEGFPLAANFIQQPV